MCEGRQILYSKTQGKGMKTLDSDLIAKGLKSHENATKVTNNDTLTLYCLSWGSPALTSPTCCYLSASSQRREREEEETTERRKKMSHIYTYKKN